MSNRTMFILIAALVALVISSCSGGADKFVPASSTPAPSFELNAAERQAMAANDKSLLPMPEFGDPGLGTPSFAAPPSSAAVTSLFGLPTTSRKVSCYTPPTCGCGCHQVAICRTVSKVCNLSERFWKVADCCAKTADVTYTAQVEVSPAGTDPSGIEVIFKRDGQEVGRANTGADGTATFTEHGVSRGEHNITVCVADVTTTVYKTVCDDDTTSGGTTKDSDKKKKDDDKKKKDDKKGGNTSTAPLTTASGCIANDPAYSVNLTGGQEDSLALPSGPTSGPIVTQPNTPVTVSAVYHDETAINNFDGFVPTYTVYDSTGNVVSTGNPVQSDAPAGSASGLKENKFTTLLTINFANGFPAGSYRIALKAFDSDQNKAGGDYGVATWWVTNPCGDTKPDCIAEDPAYSVDLTGGQEDSLALPSGPSSGPIVTAPNTAITVSAVYHDETPINPNPGFTPTYTVSDLDGNVISTGAPVQSAAPAGAENQVGKENKYLTLLTVNLVSGLPAGTYRIDLKAWDNDQNKKGGDYGVATWYVTNPCGCDCDLNHCDSCVTAAVDGFFCASLDFAVYTECIHGAVTGTGYWPSCNPMRVGQRDRMDFRTTYDNGAVQGYLNYFDGSPSPYNITNGQVKWLLIAGVDSWFGGDNFMVHVTDGGPRFSEDFFEIWVKDPATCTCFHCGGKLTGCYVHVSYKYTSQCP